MSLLRLSLVASVALTAVACHHGEAEKEEKTRVAVHCVHPRKDAVAPSLSLRGKLAPPPGGDLSVASQVAGRVVDVLVKEGQRVALGELLANVDDAPSRDALRQADAAVAQAKAAEVNATVTLERTRELVARGIAAKQELDDAVAREGAARATTAAAVASADLSRRTLGRVAVRSSLAGVVTKIWRGPGALVDGTAATPLVQLAGARGAEFVADATQQDLARITEGQPVTGTLVLGDVAFEGTVRARASALDPATGLGSVRITLDKAVDAPVGAYGLVRIETGKRDALLVIPSTAVRGSVSDGVEVAVCAGEKIEIRTVTLGFRDEARVEVVKGLTANDAVAVDHVLGLDNETPITVTEGVVEPK